MSKYEPHNPFWDKTSLKLYASVVPIHRLWGQQLLQGYRYSI
jgi:hypothetical protein